MYGVLAPLAYAAFLIGSLLIFSRVYRKRQAKRAQREPWFGPHHARDIYVSLLSMDPPPPRNVLVSALIRRAVTDIQRVMEIRENKAALQNLLIKGQIGDDTWNHLLETEKEMDSELYEVVQEANHFKPGWGQYIFPHAGDMIQHEKNKKLFDTIDEERKRLAEKYSKASSIQPAPILGLVGGKRTLPSTTPSNAQLPGSAPASKPGTPAPSSAQQQAQLQAAMQQRAALQQAQQQHALNMQRQAQLQQQQQQQQQRSSTLSPQSTPSKSAAQSKNNSPLNGGTSTPNASANGKTKTTPNGSGTSSPNPTMMLRQPSTTSTNDSDAEDDNEDGDEVASSGVGSPPTASGTKKTPKKKNKKKGKKK